MSTLVRARLVAAATALSAAITRAASCASPSLTSFPRALSGLIAIFPASPPPGCTPSCAARAAVRPRTAMNEATIAHGFLMIEILLRTPSAPDIGLKHRDAQICTPRPFISEFADESKHLFSNNEEMACHILFLSRNGRP